jgi:RNA polymerase sigma-70 factor (ECF subfamily)
MPMTPEHIQTFSSAIPLHRSAEATPLDDLQSIVGLYEGRVFRFLLSTLRDRDAAETLTQETFLKAWSARSSFRSDCSVSTWLLRIALNLARDHTRTNRFRFWKKAAATAVDASDVASSLPSREVTPEAQLLAREQVQRIWETVANLSDRQRSVFLLRFQEELEIPEIAEVTGLPVGTVKSHLYRALAVVRANHSPAMRTAL